MDPVATAARQAATLQETAHRPWPLPDGGWRLGQSWLDLLFAHWTVPADSLRPLLPRGLELDLFEGDAWLAITPFALEGLRLRGVPPAPYLSDFLELNVRTYVTAEGKPGIWFFSLDASSRFAVAAARRFYRLPYFHASIRMRRDGRVLFTSRRGGARFDVSYSPSGPVHEAEEGSLEYFLTERYCLYASDGDALFRAEIHHPPWPLQAGQATIDRNTMPPSDIGPLRGEPLLHYASRQDVVVWPLEEIGR